MKNYKYFILLLLIFFSASCAIKKKYDANDFQGDNPAKLTFHTKNLTKTRLFLFETTLLQLLIYYSESIGSDQKTYMGTIELSSKDKGKSIFLPADREVCLLIRYLYNNLLSGFVCKPSLCYNFEKDVDYSLLFERVSDVCSVKLINSETNETIIISND